MALPVDAARPVAAQLRAAQEAPERLLGASGTAPGFAWSFKCQGELKDELGV